MKVILLETVETLGTIGEIVDVRPGYARNFLFPRGMAILATPQALRSVQSKIEALKKQEEEIKANLMKEAEILNEQKLVFPVKVGEEGKLFGSVTAGEIAEKLSETLKRKIEKGSLDLPEPLKALGEYKVPVKLGHGVHAQITVQVIEEGTEETPKEKTKRSGKQAASRTKV